MSEINDLYIVASRKKYTFPTGRGTATTYDLFDLTLKELDAAAVTINNEIEKTGAKSFLGKKSAVDQELVNKLEILKYVIATKEAEADALKLAREKREQAAKLRDLIERKKESQLEGLTVEELEKRLAESLA